MARITSIERAGEDGPEKLCTVCQEWWPADEEFFHRQKVHGVMKLIGRCIACDRDRATMHRHKIAQGEQA
jgi:hypothetical protein